MSAFGAAHIREIISTVDRARADELAAQKEAEGDTKSQESEQTPYKRVKKAITLALPHVGLIGSLMTYLSLGALCFILIEREPELETRRQKLHNVTRAKDRIIKEATQSCTRLPGKDKESDLAHLESILLPLLHELSWAHEYQDKYHENEQMWTFDIDNLRELWTFPTSVFYTLTVATSTGYERVSPRTDAGRLFTVCFGLLGIPLLFITAADIGKFMSEIVTRSYANEEEKDEIQLPFMAYFALILGYCAAGSLMLNTIEYGVMWSFVYGFFFGFNAITTIGVGDIAGRNGWYMCLIVAYVIVGLAVITMCIDLASSQVKEMLHLIAAMKYKNDVTLDDIITFLTVQEKLNRRPYIPRNVYFLKWIEEEDRRLSQDTIHTNSSKSRGRLPPITESPRKPSTISEEYEEEVLDNVDGDYDNQLRMISYADDMVF